MVEVFQPPPPPNPRPAVHYSRPTKTGDTVFVACNLPHGLILRVFEWEKYTEPKRDGTVGDAKRSVPIAGMEFIVRGPWSASAGQAYVANNGAIGDLLPGGYAISEGCPKEVWTGWLEQNKRSHLVLNRIVRANKSRLDLIAEIVKDAGVLSGLEPLDRANPGARMGGIDRRLRFGIMEQGNEGMR